MAVFAYTALSSDGKQTTGSVPAESRAAAVAMVSGRGLTPVFVQEISAGGKAVMAPVDVAPERGGRVTGKHVEAFTRELANLLAGGVPLARALFLLQREAKDPGPKALWGTVHDDVTGGASLADTLAQHPKVFSHVYVAMIRAGEAGGFLSLVLNQIAEFRAREQELKGKVKAALIYPCVLACFAVLVVTLLMTFFIPRFAQMFASRKASLPMLTELIMGMSNFVTSYGLYILIALVIGVVFLVRAIKTDEGKRAVERFWLKFPGVGTVLAHFAMVRFCRMLGTLLTSGVPLVNSLKVAREAIGNQTLADTVLHGIDEVKRGQSLARALGEAKSLFPAGVIEMIAIAEETGRLDKELVRLAATYEGELDRKLRSLVSLMEPILIFMMAAIIGTIVLGMLLPIFTMSELISK
jgi:type II secretory pathway component PulF